MIDVVGLNDMGWYEDFPEAGISGRDKLLHPKVYCGM